jgi:hypothetical protein
VTSKYSNIQIFSIPDAMLYSVEHPELPEQYVRIEDFERLRAALDSISDIGELGSERLLRNKLLAVMATAREALSPETGPKLCPKCGVSTSDPDHVNRHG